MKLFPLSLVKSSAFGPHGDKASSAASRADEGLRFPDKEEDRDLESIKQAAISGDADAQNALGEYYYYGSGMLDGKHITNDNKEAFNWWSMAAKQGNANAQRRLGDCYWFGDGVSQDKAASFHWYNKAAFQGDAEAQYCLAFLYLHGIKVLRNKEEAIKLYQESAKRGYAPARKCLEDLKQNRND